EALSSQTERRSRVVIQIEQPIGKLIQRQSDITKSIGQALEDIIQFAPARDSVRRNELVARSADLLVEFDVRPAPQTAPLGVLVKNAADEKRVIANVRPKQKRLLRTRPGQRDEHVGNIFVHALIDFIGDLQPVRARKRFEQRRHVIAKLPVADSALLQDVPGQNVKVKLRRYPQMSAVIQDCVHQSWMIENRIARFDIAQKIDQRNLIGLRTRERAHGEVEIGGGEPRPTIRSDHRELIVRDGGDYCKPDCLLPLRAIGTGILGAARGPPACVAKIAIWWSRRAFAFWGASSTCARLGSTLTISGERNAPRWL